MGLGKCVMTCIYHHRIMQNNFTALKTPLGSTYPSFLTKLTGIFFFCYLYRPRAFLVAQMVKNLLIMQETCVQSLGWEDPLEKEMATHSSILTWRIPWT